MKIGFSYTLHNYMTFYRLISYQTNFILGVFSTYIPTHKMVDHIQLLCGFTIKLTL